MTSDFSYIWLHSLLIDWVMLKQYINGRIWWNFRIENVILKENSKKSLVLAREFLTSVGSSLSFGVRPISLDCAYSSGSFIHCARVSHIELTAYCTIWNQEDFPPFPWCLQNPCVASLQQFHSFVKIILVYEWPTRTETVGRSEF